MSNLELALITFGMILGTALPRALPMTLLADRPLSPKVFRWLSFVPAAILAALVAPDIFLADGRLNFSLDNIFLLAALPTLLVAWKTRSLFGTLAIGMALVALIRWVMP